MSATELVSRGTKPKNRWQRLGTSPTAPLAAPQPAIETAPSGRKLHAVRQGRKLDAERWRAAFLAALHFEGDPDGLHTVLLSGVKVEAWRMLLDKDNLRFKTFQRFCLAPQPFGLDTPPEKVETLLRSLVGKRRTDLLAVAEPQQGARTDLAPTSGPGGAKSKRHEKRLRAVNRAPEPIRRLCELRIISYKKAEFCGREAPPPDHRVAIERFAEGAERILAELGDSPSEEAIKEARREAKGLLPTPDKVQPLLRQVERLTVAQREEVLRKINLRDSEENVGCPNDQVHTARVALPARLHERLLEAAELLGLGVSDLVCEGIILALRYHHMGTDLPFLGPPLVVHAEDHRVPEHTLASKGAP